MLPIARISPLLSVIDFLIWSPLASRLLSVIDFLIWSPLASRLLSVIDGSASQSAAVDELLIRNPAKAKRA